jgi:class 3 adenylate cyclase
MADNIEELNARISELEKHIEQKTQDLNKEKEMTEKLLHNILPAQEAKELMETGSTKPARFEEVSIIFTDFKQFTNIVASIPTRKLIAELNDIFSSFDDIMVEHGIEKIQTVGDAYLAVCGLPDEVDDHAMRCVQASKKMIDYLEERNESSAIKWKIRVGIHSGPISAGVVGKKKFSYNIFGDSINIASRVESAGEEGRINISAYTYDLVKDHCPCEYRGKINAKGKGELDMYFVE